MESYRSRQILHRVLDEGRDRPAEMLVRWCAEVLPVSGAAVVLMSGDQPAGTVASSGAAAADLEELQFVLGEGPCVECSRTGRAVLVPDVSDLARDRWPAFAARAAERGACALFSLPLRVGEIRLGVLDLHRDVPGAIVDGDLAEALAFADAATALLLHLQGLALTGASPGGLPPALDLEHGRAVVHQATGMVSVQTGLDLPAALVLLRARAYTLDMTVAEVARGVVDGTLDVRRPAP